MDINSLLFETLITSIPSVFIVIVLYLLISRMMKHYLEVKDYKNDVYRHDLEVEISKLNDKISYNEDRFKSVNHLLLEGNQKSFTGKVEFLAKMGVNPNIIEKEKTVFVLTPFNPDFDDDYKWVENAFKPHKYICSRGDEVRVNENLLAHIIREMLESTFVVANISGRNPNVFYELGIAHALGKDIVMITKSSDDITFDLSSSQVIIYKSEKDLFDSLTSWLVSTLDRKVAANKQSL